MTPARKRGGPEPLNAETRLRAFIHKFEPKDQRLIRAVRQAVRKRIPTANELVWDNYNFLVIGYSPTERPTDSIVSIAARQRRRLVFHSRSASSRSQEHPSGLWQTDTLHSLGVRERAGSSRCKGAHRRCNRSREDAVATQRTGQADHSFGGREAATAANAQKVISGLAAADAHPPLLVSLGFNGT